MHCWEGHYPSVVPGSPDSPDAASAPASASPSGASSPSATSPSASSSSSSLLRADGLADELHVDARLDRPVEPDLLEVDVGDVPADRILLVVLEDRRVRRLLAFEEDVEDRVQTACAREDATQLPFGDADRVRHLPVPVEDAGDEPLPAQSPRVGGATPFTLPYLQLDPLTRHFRRRMLATCVC